MLQLRTWLSPVLLGWLCLLVFVSGCDQGPQETTNHEPATRSAVSVAAAANLKFAFDELKTAFERQHPELVLEITYGSSGTLFAQLTQHAPFDIFFPADAKSPQQLVASGLASEEDCFPYATGRLVVWVLNSSPLDLEGLGVRAVADSSVKKVAIANPRLAPYGVAAEEVLRHFEIADVVRDRIVLGENITQAAHFVASGAADVGILALSLALSSEMKEKGRFLLIDEGAHAPINQSAVIPTASRNRTGATQLREFVLGPEGRAILAESGYAVPKEQ